MSTIAYNLLVRVATSFGMYGHLQSYNTNGKDNKTKSKIIITYIKLNLVNLGIHINV